MSGDISCLLIKIASRCNLNCDYCYMYHHADQSWQQMPAFLSGENEVLLGQRIGEYLRETGLERMLIIYHGGEPLLAGIPTIQRITENIRSHVTSGTVIDFSLQTNGTLLTNEILDALESLDISVSLSMDGPEAIHDAHRRNHAGKPSFQSVEKALDLLVNRPAVFTGVISVIDASYNPRLYLEYFSQFELPSLDFLLPDANHIRLPPGRAENPTLYVDWLINCFDLWFDEYSHMPMRFFDAILNSLVGLPTKTDALGFGEVSLLTIETDGSYHDLDVLKVAFDGATQTGMTLAHHSIREASRSKALDFHNSLLQKQNLCPSCLSCPVVDTCAGGAVPHRYSEGSFNNPSVYCKELYNLITHVKKRLDEQLSLEAATLATSIPSENIDLSQFETSGEAYPLLTNIREAWGMDQVPALRSALAYCKTQRPKLSDVIVQLESDEERLRQLSIHPAVFAWTSVITAALESTAIFSIDGKPLPIDLDYVANIGALLDNCENVQYIHRRDHWLRLPFGEKILYEDEQSAKECLPVLEAAYELIGQWDPNILEEVRLIAPELQLIKDLSAHPDKIVSFSDNSVPGALYVTIRLGEKFIDPADLADSILHEYRHQKLYLLQRISDVVLVDFPLIPSPWREELRPPSGLYHAIYVFTFLRKFWSFLARPGSVYSERAQKEVALIDQRIASGIATLRTTKLTETGVNLLDLLAPETIAEQL